MSELTMAERERLMREAQGMVRLAEGLGYTLPWANLLDACAGLGSATQVRDAVDDLIDRGAIEATPAGLRSALTAPPDREPPVGGEVSET